MKKEQVQTIPVGRIFLDLENPRHEPYENENDVIEYLCNHEHVYALAKDIVQNGLNPLERFALLPSGKKQTSGFIVAEGNRRICAIKLLKDPDRAPPKLRKAFEDLAAAWKNISEVPAVIFNDKEEVKLWLERIHTGAQNGIGRKDWSSEQKTRFSGINKNKSAQAILDYAEKGGLLTAEERRGKLTTVQRYLSNVLLREAMGIDQTNPNDISRNRPKEDFDLLLKTFLEDLSKGVVSSRSNKETIDQYARKLSNTPNQTGTRIAAESISVAASSKRRANKKPKKIKKPTHIHYEDAIMTKLESLGGRKLPSLYYSICAVTLEEHTPLVAVGTWSFFESLSARAGRAATQSFDQFFNNHTLQQFGFSDKDKRKAIRDALEQISKYGNTTKHHEISAQFNGEQLANDMETLKELILICLEKTKH